ncbi:hypothetical protein VIGAN_10163800 [Vigna angularis var. angularis]|uniref:Uncharacterized protein n=1 Tax=Vigna angularis var. angularis TaxID=157739 RepID=A0A0S3T4X2_PHAAN|nr:hypothetical protein VIGAN_10163800 [Vigna angularis var. angularis]
MQLAAGVVAGHGARPSFPSLLPALENLSRFSVNRCLNDHGCLEPEHHQCHRSRPRSPPVLALTSSTATTKPTSTPFVSAFKFFFESWLMVISE